MIIGLGNLYSLVIKSVQRDIYYMIYSLITFLSDIHIAAQPTSNTITPLHSSISTYYNDIATLNSPLSINSPCSRLDDMTIPNRSS